jgi:rubrerythrin
MTVAQPTAAIETAGELLTHAYQMELEAQERYGYLAEQMDVHNNVELARLFRELARVEGLHASDILERLMGMNRPQIGPLEYKWPGGESPEALDMGEMHYMMTPREALMLALMAEQNAFEFFDRLVKTSPDEETRRFAAEFAQEEQEHVELVLGELKKYPETGEPPREDMDPPTPQD